MTSLLKLLKNKNFTRIVQLLAVRPVMEYLKQDISNIHLVILLLTVFNVIIETVVSLIEMSTSSKARRHFSKFLFRLVTDVIIIPTIYFQFITNQFYNFGNWVSLLNVFYWLSKEHIGFNIVEYIQSILGNLLHGKKSCSSSSSNSSSSWDCCNKKSSSSSSTSSSSSSCPTPNSTEISDFLYKFNILN